MRISVLTGLLACVLILGLSSNKASAMSLDLALLTEKETSAVAVLEAAVSPFSQVNQTIEPTDVPELEEPTIIEHVVEENESLSTIAVQYDTTWKRLFDKNTDLESPDIINAGETIVIPEDDEELEERAVPASQPVVPTPAVTIASPAVVSQPSTPVGSSAGNRYSAGYCTWYVKSRRPDLPNNLGDAATWVIRAAGQGYTTSATPRVGAVGQRNNHVVYVESVNNDGTVTISEMNYRNLYERTTRTVAANYFTYIH